MQTLSRNRGYRLTLGIAVGLIIGLGFTSVSQAERLSLSGLKTQIDGVESQVQSVEELVCGTEDSATCAADIAPSVLERIEALEMERDQLLAALCDLAAQTGAILPECGPIDGALRLVDGAAANEGRLEVFGLNPFTSTQEWGTVCDDRFDATDALVACRQLGFTGTATPLFTSSVPDGTGPIFLDDLQCTGSESRLVDCLNRGFGSHNCSHFEDAGARCE